MCKSCLLLISYTFPVSVCGNLNRQREKQNADYKCRQSSDHSPSVDSDNPSSDVDSGRDSDEASRSVLSSADRPRKKKQRTTFSPIEVYELEKVFAQRPYLMPEDEDELVQKLGLTARNIRVRSFSSVNFKEKLVPVFFFFRIYIFLIKISVMTSFVRL